MIPHTGTMDAMGIRLGTRPNWPTALGTAALITFFANACSYPTTPAVQFTHPGTGAIVTCGPYQQYPGRGGSSAEELQRACIDRHVSTGYMRAP